MDGSDSEALEHLRDLYTVYTPVDHKTFAAANYSFHSGFFLTFYKTVVLSKSFTKTGSKRDRIFSLIA